MIVPFVGGGLQWWLVSRSVMELKLGRVTTRSVDALREVVLNPAGALCE